MMEISEQKPFPDSVLLDAEVRHNDFLYVAQTTHDDTTREPRTPQVPFRCLSCIQSRIAHRTVLAETVRL